MTDFIILKPAILRTVTTVLIVTAILLVTGLVAKVFRRWMNRVLSSDSSLPAGQSRQYTFLKHLLTGLIYLCGFAGAVYMIPPIRHLSVSVFASSGILAAVIGFAGQHSIANIISGIFIAIFQPFRIGDRIKMLGKEISGVVEDITLRHTIIRTFENKRVVVPNSVITTEIIENSNLIDETICKFIELSVSYDADLDKAMELMREEALKHPDCLDARNNEERRNDEPVVVTRVIGFGESSVNLRAWVWCKDQPTAFRLGCDLNKSIKQRFDQNGIEIPFPYRTIVYKKDMPSVGGTG